MCEKILEHAQASLTVVQMHEHPPVWFGLHIKMIDAYGARSIGAEKANSDAASALETELLMAGSQEPAVQELLEAHLAEMKVEEDLVAAAGGGAGGAATAPTPAPDRSGIKQREPNAKSP